MQQLPRAQLSRHPSATGCIEVAMRPPPLSLRPYVRDYCGYTETSLGRLQRREFPAPQAVVIFEFGPPIRILDHDDEARSCRYQGGFVAGLDDSYTLTEHDGFQHGLQVNFTPIGARLFLGVPMAELTGRVVALGDLFDAEARRFARQLEDVGEWDTRFDLLDRFIAARIARARGDARVVSWAVDRITARSGLLDIGALARDTGYSQKHLITLFHDFVGVTPKRLARIVRFDCVVQRLKAGGAGGWAELAADFGYYDQAHLVRDFRQFTGATPTHARNMLVALPDLGA